MTCYRCHVLPRHALGLVLSVTSMYSVITGRRVDLLSLGPILYSATRSTASVRYERGARNFSGCRSGVTGDGAPAEATGRRGAISTRGVGAQKLVKPLPDQQSGGGRERHGVGRRGVEGHGSRRERAARHDSAYFDSAYFGAGNGSRISVSHISLLHLF